MPIASKSTGAERDPANSNLGVDAHQKEKEESSTTLRNLHSSEKLRTKQVPKARKWKTPSVLRWIPANWTSAKLKPVIRCSIVAWLSAVLFVIPSVEAKLGQVRLHLLLTSLLHDLLFSRLASWFLPVRQSCSFSNEFLDNTSSSRIFISSCRSVHFRCGTRAIISSLHIGSVGVSSWKHYGSFEILKSLS